MEDTHISDEDLLSALDGEQPAARLAQVRSHLADCWPCRARSSELEHAIRAFVETYHRADGTLSPETCSRALFKARLSNLVSHSQAQGKRLSGVCRRVLTALLGR